MRIRIRGGNRLQSQLPSTRVYGDYQLIIAINSSIFVNNRIRSAAECHLYYRPLSHDNPAQPPPPHSQVLKLCIILGKFPRGIALVPHPLTPITIRTQLGIV